METEDMPHGVIGFRFAQALVDGDYKAAQSMLNSELKSEYSPLALKEAFDRMSELFQSTPHDHERQNLPWIKVLDNRDLDQESLDAEGWAYVAIGSEAVTVTVKLFGSEYLITALEWGRP